MGEAMGWDCRIDNPAHVIRQRPIDQHCGTFGLKSVNIPASLRSNSQI